MGKKLEGQMELGSGVQFTTDWAGAAGLNATASV